MQLKSKSNKYQDGNKFPYLYKPIISGQVVADGNLEQVNYPLLLGSGTANTGSGYHISNSTSSSRCGTRNLFSWKMGVISITGCGFVILAVWLLITSHFHHTECCNSNLSRINLWPFASLNAKNETSTSISAPLPEFKEGMLQKISHKVMSISLKYIVQFILLSENFKFSCPHNANTNVSNVRQAYPDQLDCQKYYECDDNGRYSTAMCDDGKGFDKLGMKCVDSAEVKLCQDVGILRNYNCSSTGLHPFNGDCNKFIVCTREKVAFVANCNAGDFFDPNLLICLSSTETEC